MYYCVFVPHSFSNLFSLFSLQLLERCKNVDVEDYDRMKKLARDVQVVIFREPFKHSLNLAVV